METLFVFEEHRDYTYSKSKDLISGRFETFSSSGFNFSSSGFNGINCRTFQSGAGILPSPAPIFTSYDYPLQLETPKSTRKTNPIAINPKPSQKNSIFCDDFSSSELWAGPAYSNSPPPSSLPIPKFSLRQKRSASFDFPDFHSEIDLYPMSKSAPATPARDSHLSHANTFFLSTDSATKSLRKILNLDL